MKLLHQILLLLTCLLQASPLDASSNLVIPTHTQTFSNQEPQKLENEEKAAVFHFARSCIEEISLAQTTSHFPSSKQSPSFLKDAFQNFGVLHLEKSISKSWGGSNHFSTKEKLGLVEHRAREVLEDDVQGAGKWLDDLDVLLGAGTKTKINNWISNGLSDGKLQIAFANSSDKAGLLNKLEASKSIYHQRVHIADWDNIPGVTKSNYVNNSLPKQEIPAGNFGVNDANYNLPSYRAATFTDNVELITLPENTKIYRVTDVGGEGGAFWTLTPPSNLDDVIGGTAVMPEWNGFSKVVEYTVPNGGIKVWKGKAAAQQISENPLLISNTHKLAGGDYQVFINEIERNQQFKNAIVDVTTLYKTW